MGAPQYGQFYWCIVLADEKATEVYLHADALEVTSAGVLQAWHLKDKTDDGSRQSLLGFAPGEWKYYYGASLVDGHAVVVEHWEGVVISRPN